ncbi:hypothetical protein GCM10010441_01570 [Kitasatospora paracochleata]|uniref:Uncharacterized protein n=1 Tax=Kitasatospora paracochleata TaxID=58354 RepID=A0ABT1J2T3_9ACTN|nr:hypothetical protein [Kitasatospora paracochleata]MCP2311722.1 hypothetical protein [Kitasatospora paracochleata]
MDASSAAVFGAAVGALGGLGGGVVAAAGQARQQRRQHDRERQRWRDEVRRAAYGGILTATKQLSNALWKAADQLAQRDADRAEWQARHEDVHNAWTQFSAAVADVGVAGPQNVVDAAEDLRHVMYDWEMICTAWTHTAIREGSGHVGDFADRFKAAAGAKRAPDRAFQVAARRALGTND